MQLELNNLPFGTTGEGEGEIDLLFDEKSLRVNLYDAFESWEGIIDISMVDGVLKIEFRTIADLTAKDPTENITYTMYTTEDITNQEAT